MRLAASAWLCRYGPLEAAGTAGAVAGAAAVAALGGPAAVVALAGVVGENAGFYGLAGWRAARAHRAVARADGLAGAPAARRVVRRTVLGLAAEFGPAEGLDSAFVRPALMFAATAATGHAVGGVVLGKILADAVFYGIAALSYLGLRAHGRACPPQEATSP